MRSQLQIVVFVAMLGSAFVVPAKADMVTYLVSGTFSDGGTFTGTFGYDPVANTFGMGPFEGPVDTQQFDITTTGGSQGLANTYLAGGGYPSGYDDFSSTPTELFIQGGGVSGASQAFVWELELDWKTPLNAAGGSSPQPITFGGFESDTMNCPGPSCKVISRTTITGTVELAPVPLPAAAWLMLSGIGGIGIFMRRSQTA